MTFARIIGITVATSIAVFLGLTIFLPRHNEEKAQTAGVTPDQVFAAAATPPAPGETPAAAPAETSNPAAPATGAPTTAPSSAPASADTASTAPASDSGAPAPAAPQQGLSNDEARKIAEDVGRKVATRVVEEKSASSAPATDSAPSSASSDSAPSSAPSAPSAPAEAAPASTASNDTASSSTGATTTLTESDVRRIAAEEARRVYAEGGGSSHSHRHKAKPATDDTASAAPAASESAPAPAAESAPAPAAETAPAAAEKPAKVSKSKKPGNSTVMSNDMAGNLPATDAITAWWLTTDKQPPDHLNLVYAGSAATEKSAVLLFSDPVDAAAASSHLQLFSADGKPASGSWEASPSNPRMVLFKNLSPGRYTVVIASDITSTSGKTITSGLHGPVYIR